MSVSKRPATGRAKKTVLPTPDLTAACESGDYRLGLEAMRDSLARSMQVADANVVAQIAGRLQAVLKAIDDLPEAKKVSAADDLAARRAARKPKANARTVAAGDH